MTAVRMFSLFFIALTFGFAVANIQAQADTARGCRGELVIFDRATHHGAQKELIASFEGRGTCKNKFHADDCRKRAADGIIRCAREMWATRNTGRLPPSCTEERGNSFARTQLEGILPGFFRDQSALDRARFAVCCKFNRTAAEVPANLWVGVMGDTGCISKKMGTFEQQFSGSWHAVDENALFHCSAVRSSGMCGR